MSKIDKTVKLSEYIYLYEYACPCCGELPPGLYDDDGEMSPEYVLYFSQADKARERFGYPIPWHGYRCPEYNKKKGSYLSVHMFGLAGDADVSSHEEVDYLFNIFAEINPDSRIIKYKGNQSFVHWDLGYLITPRATEKWRPGVRMECKNGIYTPIY